MPPSKPPSPPPADDGRPPQDGSTGGGNSTPPQAPTQAYELPDPERPASASPTQGALEHETPGGLLAEDPYAALRYRDYRLYLSGSTAANIGMQMLTVAVEWQLYVMTDSATALGLVGLIQALPIIALVIPSGHLADRLDRRRIVLAGLLLMLLCSLGLAWCSLATSTMTGGVATEKVNAGLSFLAGSLGEKTYNFTSPAVPVIYLLLLVMGIARAFSEPARAALVPQTVPLPVFSNAVTWSSSAFQIASTAGPAAGGLLLGHLPTLHNANYAAVYGLNALAVGVMFVFIYMIRPRPRVRSSEPVNLRSLSGGLRFVWRTKAILATITLDLFAVLLGGAVALLPVFAKDILQVGPQGLGWLRAAPAIGALLMGLVLAHLPPMRNAGKALLWAVIGFGFATLIFGLSRSFWLSLLMLALTGAFDNISVVVRHTLVQVLTPDEMRGRVSAVNNVFIGASNELGAFESGITAAAFGPVLSVVGGGVGTIVVVIAVALIWPQIRRIKRLDESARAA